MDAYVVLQRRGALFSVANLAIWGKQKPSMERSAMTAIYFSVARFIYKDKTSKFHSIGESSRRSPNGEAIRYRSCRSNPMSAAKSQHRT
jgi:hypothetical protein